MTHPTQAFHQARDFLLARRNDRAAACADFKWPQLDQFNWALDHFDVIARGNEAAALTIVQQDGSQQQLTFAQLSARSNQVANWLVQLGVKRGDRVLLMLGNQVELWESMLALMKIGAVVVPTTTLLITADLQDRVQRGDVRHVICAADAVPRFETVSGEFTRINTGTAAGWFAFQDTFDASPAFTPTGATMATDPMLLYFTSGTTSKPKLVLHTHQSYPVGHLSTMFWIGLRPGDIHLNISSPGWAKHAWSSFFAPWNAGACVFVYNYARFNAVELLQVLVQHRVTTLCAPPTVWRMLILEDMARSPVLLR